MLKELNDYLHVKIPATQCLDFSVSQLTETNITLKAPLSININDKGTGFGGSIDALAIITGWSATWVLLKRFEKKADVVIHTTTSTFKAPVKGDFYASCTFPEEETIKALWKRLEEKGKARLPLHVNVESEGTLCMELDAHYVFLND